MEEAKDPGSFRDFEYSGWEASVDEYNNAFSPLTRQTIPTIIDAVGDLNGKRVLDVACGPGDLASALAAKGAIVSAVDFAPAMIERAQRLSTQSNVDFVVDDAEVLSKFEDASFDAVVMNYGILHLGRPLAAIKAAARVLKPGGKFVFSCWQDASKAKGFAIILDSVKEVGAVAEGMPHGPNFFTFSDDDNIKSALSQAGFGEVTIRNVEQTWELKDGQALFSAFIDGTARTGGMLRKLAPADRDAVRELAVQMAEAIYTNEAGELSIPMPTKVASGTIGR